MSRTELDVPFSEKDEAKSRGARWDYVKKVWYVPEGVDIRAFSKWIHVAIPEFTVRSRCFSIASNRSCCWKCGKATMVFGFLLPPGHEFIDPDDEMNEWTAMDESAFIHNVTHLHPSAAQKIQEVTKNYRVDYSKTEGTKYWMNHCEHCKAKLGDFFMYSEPGGEFFPMDEHEAQRILLVEVDEPFAADAIPTYSSEDMFRHMRRASWDDLG